MGQLRTDRVASIETDASGRLVVRPATLKLQQIYLEAMGVHWHDDALRGTVPEQWNYGRWLRQILDAASAQGVRLIVDAETSWINIDDASRELMLQAVSDGEQQNE